MDLDRLDQYGEVDPAEALADVEHAAGQWSGAPRPAPLDLTDVDAVVVTGVGGSGICADVVAAIGNAGFPLPIVVHKTYGLPAFVGPRSLVVAVSCSGDTEETCSAADEAVRRGARLMIVAGGGRLAALGHEQGEPWVPVARDCQPRHSLGLLAVPVLAALGLDGGLDEAVAVQRDIRAACGREVPIARNPAKQLGSRIAMAGAAVVHGARPLAAVAAYRLKCQLNENAELPSFFGELPEVAHNEIVGWDAPHPMAKSAVMVMLRDAAGEHPRGAHRADLLTGLVADRFADVAEMSAQGTGSLARLASLLLFADLTSVYAAYALDRDPSPIALIDRLKRAMERG